MPSSSWVGAFQFLGWCPPVLGLVPSSSWVSALQFLGWCPPVLGLVPSSSWVGALQFLGWRPPVLGLVSASSEVGAFQFLGWCPPVLRLVPSSFFGLVPSNSWVKKKTRFVGIYNRFQRDSFVCCANLLQHLYGTRKQWVIYNAQNCYLISVPN